MANKRFDEWKKHRGRLRRRDLETRGLIFNIQKFSIHDGPGIRTTVFMKGCPLSCPWCSNPESINPHREIITRFDTLCSKCGRCLETCARGAIKAGEDFEPGNDEIVATRTIDRDLCDRCMRCVEACPTGALSSVGEDKACEDVAVSNCVLSTPCNAIRATTTPTAKACPAC